MISSCRCGEEPVPYVATGPETYLNTSVGTGQCVPLVQQATGAPQTSTWSQGAAVRNATDIQPGTAIATFDAAGTYGNHTNGSSHAAIYMGQDADGIQVIDQWVSGSGRNRRVQMAHRRTIRWRGGVGQAVDDGDQFHVVN